MPGQLPERDENVCVSTPVSSAPTSIPANQACLQRDMVTGYITGQDAEMESTPTRDAGGYQNGSGWLPGKVTGD